MKKNELISIIVLSYNNEAYIIETLNSILCQNYSNIELIITDDGSIKFDKEEYLQYVNSHKMINIVNCIVHKNEINLGSVKNINNAIKMANGKYIKLIGADDVFNKDDVILSFMEFMENNNHKIVTSPVIFCDKNLNILEKQEQNVKLKSEMDKYTWNECYKELCNANFILAPGVFFRKDLLEEIGYFDEAYRLLEDWPMWLKITRNGYDIKYLDKTSVNYRSGVGVSSLPNKDFTNDCYNCIKKEILGHKESLGYWYYKKLNWEFVKLWKYKNYSIIDKIVFYAKNLDYIILRVIPRKLKMQS